MIKSIKALSLDIGIDLLSSFRWKMIYIFDEVSAETQIIVESIDTSHQGN